MNSTLLLKTKLQLLILRNKVMGGFAHYSRKLAENIKANGRNCQPLGFVASIHTSQQMNQKAINLESMNPNIIAMQYAVRGPLAIRANEIEKELKRGIKKPFKEVIRANIGDCQAMGQKPLTFCRQVLALCAYPVLMNDDRFPPDVKKRALDILDGCAGHSIGSYTHGTGIEVIRTHIAEYIKKRDQIPSDGSNIILGTGATQVIKSVLNLFVCNNKGKISGVMVPVPQYPLYSATVAEYGMHKIDYYMDEDNGWALNWNELERSVEEAKRYCEPRVIVVINPGNPTGSVLSRENIEMVIKFANKERLFIMADEVYQDNVYGEGTKFLSFKKVMMEMGEPYKSMELASFMSTSKGYMGECGMRGGYCEIVNLNAEVKKMLLKFVSTLTCPNVLGQAAMDCLVNPPQRDEPSYNLFVKEKRAVLESLNERSQLVVKTFNSMKNIRCNEVTGAMYAFPRIFLPKRLVEKAESLGQEPDFYYAMQLLENTGICIVPGSGFGQASGTYHFRTTILPQPEKLKEMMNMFENFHHEFLDKFY